MAQVTRLFTLRRRQKIKVGSVTLKVTSGRPKDCREIELAITCSAALASQIERIKPADGLDTQKRRRK